MSSNRVAMKRFKIRNKVSNKYFSLLAFTSRGKLRKESELLKALELLKRLQNQFRWEDIEVVEYHLIEKSQYPIKEYYLDKLI